MNKITTAVVTILLSSLSLPVWAASPQITQLSAPGFGDTTQTQTTLIKIAGELVALTTNQSGTLHEYRLTDAHTFTPVELNLPHDTSVVSSVTYKGHTYLLLNVTHADNTVSHEIWRTQSTNFFGWEKVASNAGESLVATKKQIASLWQDEKQKHVALVSSDGTHWSTKSVSGLNAKEFISKTNAVIFKGSTYITTQQMGTDELPYTPIVHTKNGTKWHTVTDARFHQDTGTHVVDSLFVFQKTLYVLAHKNNESTNYLYSSADGATFTQVGNQHFALNGTTFSFQHRLITAAGYGTGAPTQYLQSPINFSKKWKSTILSLNDLDGISDSIHFKGALYLATFNHTDGSSIYMLSK